jgi:hypothetical protein
MGTTLQNRICPSDVMIERVAFREQALGGALGDHRDKFAAIAIGVAEIPSFQNGQAKRREKAW